MKNYARVLSLFLLIAPLMNAEEQKKTGEYILIFKDEEDALVYIKQERKKLKKETLQQIIANDVIGPLVPFLVGILLDYGRSLACDKLATYVPNSYKLVNNSDVQIDSRDVARTIFEGVSYICLWSFLKGSRDENDDFKLQCNNEMLIDGMNASLKYALINKIIMPRVEKKLMERYPHIELSFMEAGETNKAKRNRYSQVIKKALALSYDGAARLLKKQYMHS